MFGRPGGRWPRWIERQLLRRGIEDERVLQAFCDVPRAAFVAEAYQDMVEADSPIPIGHGQTNSQPYVIALSLQELSLSGGEKALDVGTGSGYQAALLSHLVREVYTIEYYQELYITARLAIERHHKAPVHTRHGDGSLGWPEAAPFDAIVVGARAPRIPESLAEQLAPGGRLVIPIGGESSQVLVRAVKQPDGTLSRTSLDSVVFVPLRGRQGTDRPARERPPAPGSPGGAP